MGLVRRLSEQASLELAFRTESREVEGPAGDGDHRLGSLELAPISLLVQWRPRGWEAGGFQPFLGAGANVTLSWEASGALDSADIATTIGPALQLGTDYRLSPMVGLNFDVKWNTLTLDIEDFGTTVPSIRIDPLSLGLGIGFRF